MQPLIRKSRYIHEESVASRVQLRNPTCLLYGRRQDGSYLNLDLNGTYSFLDHYDQNLLHHS